MKDHIKLINSSRISERTKHILTIWHHKRECEPCGKSFAELMEQLNNGT